MSCNWFGRVLCNDFAWNFNFNPKLLVTINSQLDINPEPLSVLFVSYFTKIARDVNAHKSPYNEELKCKNDRTSEITESRQN